MRRYLKGVVAIILLPPIAMALFIFCSGMSDHVGHADVAVVLGNKVEENGEPSPRLKARLDKAIELYKAGWFPKIIASGGTGADGYDEPAAMKRYMMEQGVPETAIIPDKSGANTWLTARFTSDLMRTNNWKSVFVVTQYYHLPRSILALRRHGVMESYSAHANYFETSDLWSICREVPAYVYYRLRVLHELDRAVGRESVNFTVQFS